MADQFRFGFGDLSLRDHAHPLVGAPILGGSEGDRTAFHDAGWREGLRDPQQPDVDHIPKRAPLDGEPKLPRSGRYLSRALSSIASVPTSARLGVVDLGAAVLATLPGEFTITQGKRTERDLRAAMELRRETPIVLVGLANEYLSYFTTAEEHAVQSYEAGSMIYGHRSGKLLRRRLVELARGRSTTLARVHPISYSYSTGIGHRLGTRDFSLRRLHSLVASYEALANVLYDEAKGIPMPNNPHIAWIDSAPGWGTTTAGGSLAPRVRVEVNVDSEWRLLRIGTEPVTDEGDALVTVVTVRLGGRARWLTYWIPPHHYSETRPLRFVIDGLDGRIDSPPFRLSSLRKRGGFVGLLRDLERKP